MGTPVAKAKASITLTVIKDIKKTTKYYLALPAASSRPNKPTTNPPTGNWVVTEPNYIDGDTNTLYVVDITEYSNDTFEVSEVSLSSSYEAAKQAWKKAHNVELDNDDNAHNLTDITQNLNQLISELSVWQIGGDIHYQVEYRPMLFFKEDTIITPTSPLQELTREIINESGYSEKIQVKTSTNEQVFQYTENQTLKYCCGVNENTKTIDHYCAVSTQSAAYIKTRPYELPKDEEGNPIQGQQLTEEKIDSTGHVEIVNIETASGETIYYYEIPHPNTQVLIRYYYCTQSYKGVDSQIKDLYNSTQLLQNSEGFTFNFTDLVDKVNTDINEMATRQRYIKLITDSEEGALIEIGDSEQGMTAIFSKTRLYFRNGQKILAEYTNNGLITDNITTRNQVKFNFVDDGTGETWAIRPGAQKSKGNNLNIVWIGG